MKRIKYIKKNPNINNIKDLNFKHNLILNKGFSINNTIKYDNLSTFNNFKIFITGENNIIDICQNSIIKNSCIYIKGNNNIIKIGNNCTLKEINLVCKNNNNKILIGNNVTTAGKYWGYVDLHVMDETSITIGNECMISGNVVIRTDDGHPIYDENDTILNKASNITIGNHVWIAQDVKILKGVKLYDGSIIGTGSIVTKSFDKKPCIIAGNPAVPINKYNNFHWFRKKIK